MSKQEMVELYLARNKKVRKSMKSYVPLRRWQSILAAVSERSKRRWLAVAKSCVRNCTRVMKGNEEQKQLA